MFLAVTTPQPQGHTFAKITKIRLIDPASCHILRIPRQPWIPRQRLVAWTSSNDCELYKWFASVKSTSSSSLTNFFSSGLRLVKVGADTAASVTDVADAGMVLLWRRVG